MALIGSLTSGVSALRSFEKGLEVIGDNVANVNTTGFKGAQIQYSDNFSNLIHQSAPSDVTANGSNVSSMQTGTGVQVASISSDFAQGTLTTTGGKTDLGISGNGFFRVRDSVNNLNYATRAGDFRLDDQGYLVTSEGLRVQGLSDGAATFDATNVGGTLTFTKTATAPATVGDIRIDFDIGIGSGLTNSSGGSFTDLEVEAAKPTKQSFTVDQLGNVIISLSNGDSFKRGRILMQNFNDTSALTRAGKNLYQSLDSAGPVGGLGLSEANNGPGANGLGKIQIGSLELSNVDLSNEFANLITTQRAFQAGSRIITVSDTVLEDVINLKRQ